MVLQNSADGIYLCNEQTIEDILDKAYYVYTQLELGRAEKRYQNALIAYLEGCGIMRTWEDGIHTYWGDKTIGTSRADIIIGNCIVECKAKMECPTQHKPQLCDYIMEKNRLLLQRPVLGVTRAKEQDKSPFFGAAVVLNNCPKSDPRHDPRVLRRLFWGIIINFHPKGRFQYFVPGYHTEPMDYRPAMRPDPPPSFPNMHVALNPPKNTNNNDKRKTSSSPTSSSSSAKRNKPTLDGDHRRVVVIPPLTFLPTWDEDIPSPMLNLLHELVRKPVAGLREKVGGMIMEIRQGSDGQVWFLVEYDNNSRDTLTFDEVVDIIKYREHAPDPGIFAHTHLHGRSSPVPEVQASDVNDDPIEVNSSCESQHSYQSDGPSPPYEHTHASATTSTTGIAALDNINDTLGRVEQFCRTRLRESCNSSRHVSFNEIKMAFEDEYGIRLGGMSMWLRKTLQKKYRHRCVRKQRGGSSDRTLVFFGHNLEKGLTILPIE